ncbi:MAG: hypothetical protein M1391_04120 [Bacteroidetes bacterium]|nr:hypothetical protein [Bacteroidota bacterium]
MTTIIKRTGQNFSTAFLSWHDGVDAMLKPTPDSPMPNVLVHAARMVNTPFGICSAGILTGIYFI